MKRQAGFTIFEMVIVLIMVGLLTAALAPLLTAQHARNMDEGEREALQKARAALISVGINLGGFPRPLDSDAIGFDDSMRPSFPPGWAPGLNQSYLPWNDPNLGENPFGSYRKYFWYDVRAELRRDYGTAGNPRGGDFVDLNADPSPQNFCRNARLALAAAADNPRVCRLPRVGEEADPCPGGPGAASPAAFTLVSFGSDFTPNMAHASLNVVSVPPNDVRNYENPARGINRNRTLAPSPFYDDMVERVSLAEIVRECERLGHLNQPIQPDGPCGQGQKMVTVINRSGGDDGVRVTVPVPSCRDSEEDEDLNLGCMVDTAVVTVHTTRGTCNADNNLKGNSARAPLSGLDSNGDGTVRFNCPTSNTTVCTID